MEASTAQADPAEVVGRRIGAALIDVAVLALVFVLLGLVLGDSKAEDDEVSVNLEGGGALLFFALAFGYYIVAEALWGKTLGKRLLGLRVTKVSGEPIEWGASIGRNLLRIVDSLPFLYLVGLIVMLATKNKQRIGDLAAGTLVVRDGSRSGSPDAAPGTIAAP